MTKTLDLIFDVVSPNAYLSMKALPDVLNRTGAALNIIPCLLGGIMKATNNKPPMIAFADVKGKMEYQRLEMIRFIKKHRLVKFKMNPHFPINSLMVMRGLVAVQRDDNADAYIDTMLTAMWEEEKKLDDPEVFAQVLRDAGFDAEGVIAGTQDQSVKDTLVANTSAAVERGVFGIPTFFVGDEMFFGKDRLAQVEEALDD